MYTVFNIIKAHGLISAYKCTTLLYQLRNVMSTVTSKTKILMTNGSLMKGESTAAKLFDSH